MSTSEITSSGWCSRARSNASRPSAAESTRCPAVSRSAASASRFARLSSATRIVAMPSMDSVFIV